MRAATALLAAVLLAGCSGGSSEPEERLTTEEYVRQADRICAEYERRLARLAQPENLADLAAMAEEARPVAEEGLDELRALRPPEALEPQVEAWLERNEENVRAIDELREAAEEGDETRVRELASAARDNEEEADRLAAAIGLEDCAARDDDAG